MKIINTENFFPKPDTVLQATWNTNLEESFQLTFFQRSQFMILSRNFMNETNFNISSRSVFIYIKLKRTGK